MNFNTRMLGPLTVVIAMTGITIIYLRSTQSDLPSGLLQANGRVEAETALIASKYAGRIQQVMVREGDTIREGQSLVILEDTLVNAKVAQADEAVTALTHQLAYANAALAVAEKEVGVGVAAARARKDHAEAVEMKAMAAEQQAAKDAERLQALFADGAVERHKQELAMLAWTASRADTRSAQAAVFRAGQGVRKAELGEEKISAQKLKIDALAARLQQAQAVRQEAMSVKEDLIIKAPLAGIVTSKIRNTGEVIAPGAPLLEIQDSHALFVKAWIQENNIALLHTGTPAKIYFDGMRDTPLDGQVSYISPHAEFTPKEVQVPDERIRQVYEIRVTLDDSNRHPAAGLPADIILRWNGNVNWQSPKG